MGKIVVIGAGIIGASTAYLLKNTYPNLDVTIIAKSFSPNTTSDGAAGLWQPLLPGKTPEHLVNQWSKDTYEEMMEIIKTNPASGKMGLMTTHGFFFYESEKFEKPSWADIPYDYCELSKKTLKRFPSNIKSGFSFTTVFIESRMLVPWYTKRFQELGGKVIQKEIKSLSEIADYYDVIVNCAGLEARKLVNDKEVVPIRGQIVKVRAPWIHEFASLFTEKEAIYVLPNQEFVVLGGTKYYNNEDLNVSLKDKESILKNTKKLFPSLEHAEPIGDWVGLRPGRTEMRVEKEDLEISNEHGLTTRIRIVHNYGHGGSGLTVHWGCAIDAVNLVSQHLHDININRTSKL